eukprot:8425979-Alexandrium_andersonii.AAC.1
MRYTPLCRNGILWSAKWEVRVDRSDRIAVKNTDQWVQPERSVQLVAPVSYTHLTLPTICSV